MNKLLTREFVNKLMLKFCYDMKHINDIFEALITIYESLEY